MYFYSVTSAGKKIDKREWLLSNEGLNDCTVIHMKIYWKFKIFKASSSF